MNRINSWVVARPVLAAFLLLALVAGPARAQTVVTDIIYESPGSTRNELDVYTPVGGPVAGKPTIIYIHGGSWRAFGKDADVPLYLELVSRGYGVVACNYSLAVGGASTFPQAIQDVKNVVRWVRVEGGAYGLSPLVIVTGPSAGAHLAMMAAMTSGNPMFETLLPPPGGYRPQGFISIFGCSDFEWHVQTWGQQEMFTNFLGAEYGPTTVDLYRDSSPLFHVTPCDPPGALFHGTADTLLPYEHSTMMAAAMQQNFVHADLTLMPDAGHSFDPLGGLVGVAQYIDSMVPVLMPHSWTPDLDGNGVLTVADFTAMLQLFSAGDPRADMDRNGIFTVADFTAYLQAYALGC